MDFIPYTQQSLHLTDIQSVLQSLGAPLITRGPKVEAFENKISELCQAKYTVAFNSGTQALSAAYYAADLSVDDEVYCSPNTFVGTVAYPARLGCRLHMLDIDLTTASPDFTGLKLSATKRSILVPVHFSGIAKKIPKPLSNSIIIEDACQAFGASYLDGSPVGSCPTSDMTVFSFHPAKTICTGEGGAVTTQSKEYYERLKLYRNNGIVKEPSKDPWMYDVVDMTANCNFTDFQAALGLSQIERVKDFLDKRRNIAQQYFLNLQDISWVSFLDQKYQKHSSYNLMTLLIDFEKILMSRKEVMEALKKRGIGTQVHFIPLYRHSYFKKKDPYIVSNFKGTELYYKKALSFPMFSHLSLEQVDRICEHLIEAVAATAHMPS